MSYFSALEWVFIAEVRIFVTNRNDISTRRDPIWMNLEDWFMCTWNQIVFRTKVVQISTNLLISQYDCVCIYIDRLWKGGMKVYTCTFVRSFDASLHTFLTTDKAPPKFYSSLSLWLSWRCMHAAGEAASKERAFSLRLDRVLVVVVVVIVVFVVKDQRPWKSSLSRVGPPAHERPSTLSIPPHPRPSYSTILCSLSLSLSLFSSLVYTSILLLFLSTLLSLRFMLLRSLIILWPSLFFHFLGALPLLTWLGHLESTDSKQSYRFYFLLQFWLIFSSSYQWLCFTETSSSSSFRVHRPLNRRFVRFADS